MSHRGPAAGETTAVSASADSDVATRNMSAALPAVGSSSTPDSRPKGEGNTTGTGSSGGYGDRYHSNNQNDDEDDQIDSEDADDDSENGGVSERSAECSRGKRSGLPARCSSSATHPHVCPVCQKAFTRREHLKRHQLSHDASVKLVCTLCNATFSRQDALKRHEALHGGRSAINPEAGIPPSSSSSPPSNGSAAWLGSAAYNTTSARSRAAITKTRKACSNCSRQKIKCDGQPTCRNCKARPGTLCEYPAKRSAPPSDHHRADTVAATAGSPAAKRPRQSGPGPGPASIDRGTEADSDFEGGGGGGGGDGHDLMDSQFTPSTADGARRGSASFCTPDGSVSAPQGSHSWLPAASPAQTGHRQGTVPSTSALPSRGSVAGGSGGRFRSGVADSPFHSVQFHAMPQQQHTSPDFHTSSHAYRQLPKDWNGDGASAVDGSAAAAAGRPLEMQQWHDPRASSALSIQQNAAPLYQVPAHAHAREPPAWSDQRLPEQDWLDAAFSDSSMLIGDQTFDWLFAPLQAPFESTAAPSSVAPVAAGFAASGWPLSASTDAAAAAILVGTQAIPLHNGQSSWPELAQGGTSTNGEGHPAGIAQTLYAATASSSYLDSEYLPAFSSPQAGAPDGGEEDQLRQSSRRSRQRRETAIYSLSKSGIQSSTADENESQSLRRGNNRPARAAASAQADQPVSSAAASSATGGPCALPDGWWRHPAASPLSSSTEPIGEPSQQDLLAEDTMQVARFTEYSKKKLLSLVRLAELQKHDEERALAMMQRISVSTYNVFLQLYFERFHVQYPMLHLPTWHPDKCLIFLLAGVIALGSLSSRIPRASKLGNLLAELANKAQFLAWHRTNLQERSLGFIQAMMLSCVFMRSTGDRRLLEFAEAIRSPLSTMTRRRRLLDKHVINPAPDMTPSSSSASFGRDGRPGVNGQEACMGRQSEKDPDSRTGLYSARTTPPEGWSHQNGQQVSSSLHQQLSTASRQPAGSAASLHNRWQAWIHAESAKRTGWAVFIADVELSVSWNLPSSFSFDELKAELPCSDASWNAANASMWSFTSRNDVRTQAGALDLSYYTVADFHDALAEGTATTLLTDEMKASEFQRAVLASSLCSLSDAVSTVRKGCLRLHAQEVTETLRSLCIDLAEQQAVMLELYHGASLALSGGPRMSSAAALVSPKLELMVRFDLLRSLVDLHDLQILGGRHSQREKAETFKRIKERFDRRPWEAWSLGVHAGRIIYFFRNFPTSLTFEGLLFFYAAISLYLVSLWWKDKGDITTGQLINPSSIRSARSQPTSPVIPGLGRLSASVSEMREDGSGTEILSVDLDGSVYVPISLTVHDVSTSSHGSGSRRESSLSGRNDSGVAGRGGSLEALAATAESSRAAAKVVRPRLKFIGDLSSTLAPKRILSSYSDQLQQRAASSPWLICEPLALILAEMVELAELLSE